jgi:predicted kinase
MKPILCLIGGCNGAGKTTLARELLPLMSIRRFLNADEIARGLSPLDPTLSAFRAGRLLIEEARALMKARSSFAIESTLSGKTHVAMVRTAKERGYRVVLHYILIDSADQAVERVALRVTHGGHSEIGPRSPDGRTRGCRGRKIGTDGGTNSRISGGDQADDPRRCAGFIREQSALSAVVAEIAQGGETRKGAAVFG